MTKKVDSLIEEQRTRSEQEVNKDLYRIQALQMKVCPDCELKMVKRKYFFGLFSFYECPECGERSMSIAMAGG